LPVIARDGRVTSQENENHVTDAHIVAAARVVRRYGVGRVTIVRSAAVALGS
jgi:hypothetical protein